jgi:hypothetical protein
VFFHQPGTMQKFVSAVYSKLLASNELTHAQGKPGMVTFTEATKSLMKTGVTISDYEGV